MRCALLGLLLVAQVPSVFAQDVPEEPPPDRRIVRLLARADAAIERGAPLRAIAPLRRAAARAGTDPHLQRRVAALLAPGAAWQDHPRVLDRAAELMLSLPGETFPGARAFARFWRGEEVDLARFPVGREDEVGARQLERIAVVLIARGRLASAEQALRRALQAWPRDPALRRSLGALHVARGDLAEGIRRFREVLHAAPDDLGARLDLAAALLARGEGDEAVAHYRRAERADPSASSALAAALLELGRPADAARAAERALAHDPEHQGAWASLGLARLATGDEDGARAALRRGEADPRARQALRALNAEQE